MTEILNQYNAIIAKCRIIFESKAKDYGASWRLYRMITVADQLYIKAKRIRTIQENGGSQKVNDALDDIASEFKGLINYSVMGTIQMDWGPSMQSDLQIEPILQRYDYIISEAIKLMEAKNTDYGSAWKEMSVESLTDLILCKILRIKSIINNNFSTITSEGVGANLYDILNYSVFCLILMGKTTTKV